MRKLHMFLSATGVHIQVFQLPATDTPVSFAMTEHALGKVITSSSTRAVTVISKIAPGDECALH